MRAQKSGILLIFKVEARLKNKCVFGQNVNVGNNVAVGDYCKIKNNV